VKPYFALQWTDGYIADSGRCNASAVANRCGGNLDDRGDTR
jgi:hypothetical protein